MKRLSLAIPLLALAFVGAGCLGGSATGPTGPDAGVWKTADGGKTWVNEKSLVQGTKVTASVASVSVLSMAFDPQDHLAIYLGTLANGILYSLDGGNSWQQVKVLTTARVSDVEVDPKSKCTVYALSANRIYKTTSCSRDWSQVFFDPVTTKSFTKIAIDWYNPTRLYAGTTDGDIYQSEDSGNSWRPSFRIGGNPVTSLVVDPHDSRVVYAGTSSAGMARTTDSGSSWTWINKQFADQYNDGKHVLQVVPDPVTAGTVYDVSKYGILKSTDAGDTWTALTLTNPPSTIKINSLAIDPTNNQHLVFTGVSTLQFTVDGGKTWTPTKLPTTQTGGKLLIDPSAPTTIYLATIPPPTQ